MSFEKDFEAQVDILARIDTLQKEKDDLLLSRRANLPAGIKAARKQVEANQQLKSDLKKSNAFVKKIKSINAEAIQQCIRDAESLNLTLFISEIVSGFVATTFKAVDVPAMVKLCVSLHQRYEEFCDPLIYGLRSALLSPPAEDDNEAGKRKRIQIRFIVELYQAGLTCPGDDDFFCQLLRNLLGKNKSTTPGAKSPPIDVLSVGTLAKYGGEILMGFVPRKVAEMAQKAGRPIESMPVKLLASAGAASEMKMIVLELYTKLSNDLVKAHKDFYTKEAKLEKDKLIHGTASEQKQQELDNAKRLYEKLLSIVTTLSECTGKDIPVLQVEKEEDEGTKSLTAVWEGGSSSHIIEYVSGGVYGDPESRAFYEDLPDLLSLVPLTVLGISPEKAEALREEWGKAKSAATEPATEAADAAETAGAEDVGEYKEDAEADVAIAGVDTDAPEGETAVDETRQAKLQALLAERLPECINKQKADDFCVAYCNLNTKNARKKLVTALLRVPRGRTELTATYARIVASLSRLYPDMIAPLLDGLKKEFFGQLRARNQLFIESKIKNVRFQGELVKFSIAPPIVAFRMFRALMEDFTPHNVELLSILLETCGRYLFLLPHTNERMNETLNTMLRLRRARNLDLRQQTMLESAYFAVKPPERTNKNAKKELTAVQKYIAFLVIKKLDEPAVSVEEVIKSIRRLPWGSKEEQVELHLLKAIFKVSRTKYSTLPVVADCISGVSSYHPNLVIQLLDRILEQIQRSLDSPYKREIQRTLGIVKLFGELYNYTVISSSLVFDLLYHIINFGHSAALDSNGNPLLGVDVNSSSVAVAVKNAGGVLKHDPRIPSDIDLATDLFRVQMVCELLNTCGVYYVRGSTKAKLSKFLLYFQRYLLTKQMIPLHIEFTILDTLDFLEETAREAAQESAAKAKALEKAGKKSGPVFVATTQFRRYDTLEEVQQAIVELEARMVDGVEEEVEEEERTPDRSQQAQHQAQEQPVADALDDVDEEESEEDSDDDGEDGEERQEEEDGEEQEALERMEREAAKMMDKLRIAEEDEDFEKAFKHVMQESITSVATKPADVNRMAIPAVLPKPKNIRAEDEEGRSESKHKGVAFKLLSRDTKGRFETRQLLVPEANPIAVKLMASEAEHRQEKEKLKQRVLQLESLVAEEGDAFPMLDPSAPAPVFGIRETYEKPSSQEHGGERTPGSGRGGRGSGRGGGGGRGANNPKGNTASHNAEFGMYHRPAIRSSGYSSLRAEENRQAADTLNLDQFLAETNAAELRRMTYRK